MKVYAVVLNWNEKKLSESCIKSLQKQTLVPEIVIVDNGSKDNSYEYLKEKFPDHHIIGNPKNLGFAGGENVGLWYCLKQNADYIVLLNNDATVEKNWIEILVNKLEKDKSLGVAAGKLLKSDGETIDSTSDQYSSWGLPIARQRNLPAKKAFQKEEYVFGATAGACVYRAETLRRVGLFDEKFFAYYEDTDLNFRLQLAGWKVLYTPEAVGYHAIGGTSSKIPGFTTYQTTKNLPMLFWKNVPRGLLLHMAPRFILAYTLVLGHSLFAGRALPALKGFFASLVYLPYAFIQRWKIQKTKTVSTNYIRSLILFDLPPDAHRLRKFRALFTGRS